jgi:hypothetical protein
MLKIGTEMLDDEVLLVLEGSLSGPWVAEVERAWHGATLDRQPGKIRIDLSDVIFVSDEGKQLLERICASGAEIFSSDLLTQALADELSHKRRGTGNG